MLLGNKSLAGCVTFFVLTILLLLTTENISLASPAIKIIEPENNTVLHPDQEFTVKIEAVNGFAIKEGTLFMLDIKGSHEFTTLPLIFTAKIPIDASGIMYIMVTAKDNSDNVVEDEITIKIQQTAALQSLMCYEKLLFETDWDGNIKNERSSSIGYAYGMYSDGIKREIPKEELTYTSSNPEVVSIDNQGNYQVHKIGQAAIIVSSSGISTEIPLVFLPPRGIRPKETIPPTIQINIQPPANSAGWHNKDITITITAQDDSGIREIDYSILGTKDMQNKYIEDSVANISFNKEGSHELVYAATDKEGNYGQTLRYNINLDKTPPQISLAFPTDKNEYFNDTVIPLTYTAADVLSGIASVTVKLDKKDITSISELKNLSLGNHTLSITALDKADNSRNIKLNFVIKLKAEVTIKPEVFLLNKGIFLAFVKFPKGFDIRAITDASCDGAKARKIIPIPTLNSSILVFKREDITQKPIDTTFTLRGHFKNGLIFEGSDTIRKVINLKDFPKQSGNAGKDKKDEDLEIDKALGEFLKNQKGNLKKVQEEIKKINH